jgi:DNA-binding transcriptional LysR family regulator
LKRPGGQRERDTVDNELPFDPNVKRQAALDGLGIAYLPEDYVRAEIEGRRLTRVLDSWCPPFPGYHLYYPSRRHQSPAFTLLVEALRYRS